MKVKVTMDDNELKFRSCAVNMMFEENEAESSKQGSLGPAQRAMGGVDVDMMGPSAFGEAPSWGEEDDASDLGFPGAFESMAGLHKSGLTRDSDVSKSGFGDLDFGMPNALSSSLNKTTSWDSRFSMGDFGITTDSSSSSDNMKPRELKPLPCHIEKYTSFYSTFSSTELLTELDRVFQQTPNLDYEFIVHKNKFSGVVREGSSDVTKFWFKLKIYKCTNPKEVLVEMQKRGGCCVGFNAFFQRTVSKLEAFVLRRGFVAQGVDNGLQAWLATCHATCGKMEDQNYMNMKAEIDSTAVAALGDMLGCAQGITLQRCTSGALNEVLADATDKSLLQVLCKNSGEIVKTLLNNLESGDDILVDDACAMLSNICEQEDLRGDIVSNLLSAIFSKLASPFCVDGLYGKRHLMKALATLSSSHGNEITAQPAFEKHKRVLQQLYTDVESKENNSKNDMDFKQNLHITLRQVGVAIH